MTQTSWPFEGVDTTETQYSRLLRNIGQGVNGVPGDNNLLVYADSSGMNVKVKVAGGLSQAIVRGHMYQSTAEETLSISASATQPRIDAVVLRLDPSANSIVLAVVTGTPATSPSAPSLTQTDTAIYELLIAHVSVPGSATTISSGNVTDKRTFIENVWTTANRKPAFLGLTGFNTTIGKLETYTGSTWEVVTPTSLDASVITSGTIDSARLATTTVAKGGTGATDAGTARSNLGITPGNIGAANASHTHPISDITSLQSALDGKQAAGSYAAASHTHDGSAITSGVLNVARIPNLDASKITSGNLTGIFEVVTSNAGQVATGLVNVKNNVGGNGIQLVGATGASAFGGNMTVAGTVNISSSLGVAGGVYAPDVYNTSITYGAYRAVWVNADGRLGNTASTKTVKQDIVPADIPADAILDVEVVNFKYIDAVEALGEKAPVEIGVIAEQLLEVPGMEKFVYSDEKGKPAGVHYERLVIAVIPQIQEQAKLISDLQSRLEALESKA